MDDKLRGTLITRQQEFYSSNTAAFLMVKKSSWLLDCKYPLQLVYKKLSATGHKSLRLIMIARSRSHLLFYENAIFS